MIDQNWQDKLKALKMTMPDSVDTDDSDMAPELDENTVATNLCPRLDIVYERKGRAGKSVTIICGFSSGIDDETISALASRLRNDLAPEDRRVAVKSLYRVIDVPMFCAYCRKKDIKPV